MSDIKQENAEKALKVFISYSRTQVHFAEELELALKDKGYTILIDRHSIAKGENFQDRLSEMILACDTVVFILSDESASSDICAWEVEEARRRSKRIFVITLANLSDGITLPPNLAGIDWIHCWRNPALPGSSQTKGFLELDTALNTDVAWLRKGTELQETAAKWQGVGSGEDSPYLLQEELLTDALAWVRTTPRNETVPELTARFITASEQAEENRKAAAATNLEEREKALALAENASARVRRAGFVGVAVAGTLLLGTLVAGGLALKYYRDAQNLSAEAQKQSSDFIAREAAAIFEKERGDHTLSMLMALQADPLARMNELRRERFGEQGFTNARAQLQSSTVGNLVVRKFESPGDDVNVVAFASDGSMFATGSYSGKVSIWDTNSQNLLNTMTEHKEQINSLCFAIDGKILVTASSDNSVRIWDVASGEQKNILMGHTRPVSHVACSHDGSKIASSSDDRTIRVWDVNSGDQIRNWDTQSSYIDSIAFSPNDTRVASGHRYVPIQIWDIENDIAPMRLDEESVPGLAIAFSPDGSLIAGGSDDGTVRIWHSESGYRNFELEGHKDWVSAIQYLKDGRLASGSDDGTVRLWEVRSEKELAVLESRASYKQYVSTLAKWNEGKRIGVWSNNGAVRIWDVSPTSTAEILNQHRSHVTSLHFSTDGNRLASRSNDGTVRLWDTKTRQEISALTSEASISNSVAFSSDNEALATGWNDGKVILWDAKSGKKLSEPYHFPRGPLSLAYTPRGLLLLSSSSNEGISVWNENGEQSSLLEAMEGYYSQIELSPVGTTVAGGFGDGTLRLWETKHGKEIGVSQEHDGEISSLAYSPEGDFIATGSFDESIRIWDSSNGDELKVLSGHAGIVVSLAWSIHGDKLVSASSDGTVRIWDVASGTELTVLSKEEFLVRSVAFSPNGKLVATGSDNGDIKFWDVPDLLVDAPDKLVKAACKELVRVKAKLAFDIRDLAKYPVLASEFAQEDQLRYDPKNPEVVVGLKSPCEGIVELPRF